MTESVWLTLAKAGVTLIFDPSGTSASVTLGQSGIERLWSFLSDAERSNADALVERIADSLQAMAEGEGLAPDTLGRACLTAQDGLVEARISRDDLIELNLEGDRLAERLLARCGPLLERTGEPEASWARNILRTFCLELVKDGATIDGLATTLWSRLLGQLNALPANTAEEIKALSVGSLVSSPGLLWQPDRFGDSALLRPEYGIVPFHGREQEIADIQAWCDQDHPIAVRLYTGAGGIGKTRLFQEACHRVRQRMTGKCRIGFFSRKIETPPDWALEELLHQETPLFLVIDYAETRRGAVSALLAQAARLQPPHKARIVLLARAQGDWWADLQRSEGDAQDLLTGPRTEQWEVTPLADGLEKRQEAFERARQAFVQRVGGDYEHGTVADPPDLSPAHFRLALFVHVAALAAARGERIEAADDLLDWVIARERRHWDIAVREAGLPETMRPAMGQSAALLTLAGVSENARAIISRAPLLQGQPATSLNFVASVMVRQYPDEDGVAGVRPDLLGEHLVDQELSSDPELYGAAFGPDTTESEIHSGLTVLTRLAARAPATRRHIEQVLTDRIARLAMSAVQVAIETGDPIGMVLAKILRPDLRTDIVVSLAEQIPYPTVALREVGVVVTTQAREVLRGSIETAASDEQAELARVTNNLASRLSDLGRWEEALAAAEEAVTIYHDLAASRPDAFRPDLATSLNNLANRLSGLGRREEALAAAEEAMTIRRDLAASRPDAFRPDLAMLLNNLANRLSDLGRREEALAAAEESVTIYRDLAASHPDAFRPDLAVSLSNLANRLSGLGRREEALAAAEEAMTIRRALAASRPDAFRPDLATSLNNLASFLSGLGHREEAFAAAEEAMTIRRDLAASRPDAFRPDLATSLHNLAGFLSGLGRREEALAAAEEAMTIRRDLAASHPDAFRPDLAMSLNNLAGFLSGLGRREEALAAAEEAVTIYRALAASRPDAFRPDLATSLNNLAGFLSDLGRREEALAAAEEAVTIYRDLAASRPDAFRPDLATSLNNLANRLSDLGRREEALAAAEEAMTIRRALAALRPAAFRPDLATSLNNLANRLSDLGRREEALAAAEEAMTIRRALAASHPDAFRPDLAMSLSNLANRLSGLGRREEALAAAEEAVTIYRALAASRPDAYRPDLATSLNNLAGFLSGLGRREEALAAAEEAVTIYRDLAASHPNAFRPDLATSLGTLGSVLVGLERIVEATGVFEEGIGVLRPAFIALPAAHMQVVGALCRDYLEACETLSEEPNFELLGPIAEIIQGLGDTTSR